MNSTKKYKTKFIAKIIINYGVKISAKIFFRKASHICLIRLDAIGDFILWLQTAKYYRQIYSDKKITLICNDKYLTLAKEITIFNHVIGINIDRYRSRDFNYFWKITKQINQQQYEIAICDMYSRVLDTSDLMIYSVNAKQKIGFMGDLANTTPKQRKLSDKWYTRLIKINDNIEFEINKNFAFIEQLAPNVKLRFINILDLMDKVESCNHIDIDIVINLGASVISKTWGVNNFAQLINSLSNSINITLLGSNAEQDLFRQLQPFLARKVNNLIGQTSLSETVNIIAHAKLFIGNDSSTSHIAVAVNTPSICILGGGHFGRFMPYDIQQKWNWPHMVYQQMDCFNCNWQCVYPLENHQTWRCISRIPVERVINLAKELLCKKI